ncbi:hypothetical protein [Tenacibaculum sp. 190524A05c]|uniref:hypothetical protein n=1 Tax=Tenacibaculum platacis TaxID=3137852 RepID=UPI0032B2CD42
MKKSIRIIFVLVFIVILSNCNEAKKELQILTNIEDARKFVSESFNEKEETLLISDKLNDGLGLNMAIIGDGILKKGYMPDGFIQKEGYRIYKYKKE